MSELTTERKKLAKERFMWLLLFMAIFTTTFTVASEVELPQEEAQIVKDQITEKIQSGTSNTIFFNNVLIGLIMFIPAIGVLLGIGSAFATGLAFSTFALDVPAYSMLFLTPFGFMELLAYSIAMSRSLFLVKYRKTIKKQAKVTLAEIGIVVGLIFFGGIIEASMLGIPLELGF